MENPPSTPPSLTVAVAPCQLAITHLNLPPEQSPGNHRGWRLRRRHSYRASPLDLFLILFFSESGSYRFGMVHAPRGHVAATTTLDVGRSWIHWWLGRRRQHMGRIYIFFYLISPTYDPCLPIFLLGNH